MGRIKTLHLKDYDKKESGTLEIGDVVVAKPRLGGIRLFEIDEVTKTLAKCDMGTYITRFPREIGFGFQSLPRDTWNTTEYQIYSPKKNDENSL